MSSHHFVKEGQEPALLIAEALSLEVAQPLLEWAPQVVVLESALDAVLAWVIKIDVVVCEATRAGLLKDKLHHQEPVEILSYFTGDDPIQKAALYLTGIDQKAVNLMAEPSEVYFQIIQKFPQLQIVLISRDVKWSFYPDRFEKWMPAKSRIYTRKSHEAQHIKAMGLVDRGTFLEVLTEGMVSLDSDVEFWVGEPL